MMNDGESTTVAPVLDPGVTTPASEPAPEAPVAEETAPAVEAPAA